MRTIISGKLFPVRRQHVQLNEFHLFIAFYCFDLRPLWGLHVLLDYLFACFVQDFFSTFCHTSHNSLNTRAQCQHQTCKKAIFYLYPPCKS